MVDMNDKIKTMKSELVRLKKLYKKAPKHHTEKYIAEMRSLAQLLFQERHLWKSMELLEEALEITIEKYGEDSDEANKIRSEMAYVDTLL